MPGSHCLQKPFWRSTWWDSWMFYHDEVIKWNNFPRYRSFVNLCEGSLRLPENSLHKCQWHGAHNDVIKWKHFPRYWPFVRGNHRPPVNSPHKGQWRGALMFSMICVWINGWVNNRKAGDLRRYRAHFDVIVMCDVFFGERLNKRLSKP